jgi:6-phosphogluconolactonase
MLVVLAAVDLDWEHVHVYQVDERVAPEGDPNRNATLLRRALLEPAPIPSENVHLLPVDADDLDAAARQFGSELPVLDVVHLGIGADGHTASWPPGDPVVSITDRLVAVVGPFNGHVRMTITPPAVDQAERVVFLVTGAAKRDALARVLRRDPSVPATRVGLDRAVIYCDEATQ